MCISFWLVFPYSLNLYFPSFDIVQFIFGKLYCSYKLYANFFYDENCCHVINLVVVAGDMMSALFTIPIIFHNVYWHKMFLTKHFSFKKHWCIMVILILPQFLFHSFDLPLVLTEKLKKTFILFFCCSISNDLHKHPHILVTFFGTAIWNTTDVSTV